MSTKPSGAKVRLRSRLASLHKLVAGAVTDHRSHQRLLIEEALTELRMHFGTIGMVSGDYALPKLWVARAGANPLSERTPLDQTLTGVMVRRGGATLTCANLSKAADRELREHVQVREHNVRSFASTSIKIEDDTYFFTVASQEPLEADLDSDDCSYMELLAALFARSLREEEQEQRIASMTYHDRLTSLPLESVLRKRLDHLIAERDSSERFAVVSVDLNIRRLLEQYEYEIASRTLAQAAQRLRAVEDQRTLFYRSGSLDLVGVAEDAHSSELVEHFVSQIQAQFVQPFVDSGKEIVVTPTIGVAVFPQDGANASELLSAVTEATRSGKNTVVLANHPSARRRKLIDDLQNALERREFVLHYQPFIAIATEDVLGVEALVRWNNPELGQLPPALFIPLAEEAGIIVAIGSWVMQEAARFSKSLADRDTPLMVTFNVCAPQFRDSAFLERLDRALLDTRADPERLEIEVTESVAIHDADSAKHILNECRKRRLRIALDDFGTGYSSLSHLRELPADVVKIDRSFVATLPDHSESGLICSAIIELAHRLGIAVHAEGVETPEQLEWLRAEGCDLAQGYHISRPLPGPDFLEWLSAARTLGTATEHRAGAAN